MIVCECRCVTSGVGWEYQRSTWRMRITTPPPRSQVCNYDLPHSLLRYPLCHTLSFSDAHAHTHSNTDARTRTHIYTGIDLSPNYLAIAKARANDATNPSHSPIPFPTRAPPSRNKPTTSTAGAAGTDRALPAVLPASSLKGDALKGARAFSKATFVHGAAESVDQILGPHSTDLIYASFLVHELPAGMLSSWPNVWSICPTSLQALCPFFLLSALSLLTHTRTW